MKKLTNNQRKLYELVYDYIKNNDKSPSLEELRTKMKLASINSIVQYLDSLEKKGLIKKIPNKKRNIEIIDVDDLENKTTINIPVLASAGCDDLSVEVNNRYNEFINIDKKIIGNRKNVVAVKAKGDSMNDAGINDNDYVLVEPTDVASSGDEVVAIVDNNITIKILEKTKDFVILKPKSKDKKYRPIILSSDFKIAGKVFCTIPYGFDDVETKIEPIL